MSLHANLEHDCHNLADHWQAQKLNVWFRRSRSGSLGRGRPPQKHSRSDFYLTRPHAHLMSKCTPKPAGNQFPGRLGHTGFSRLVRGLAARMESGPMEKAQRHIVGRRIRFCATMWARSWSRCFWVVLGSKLTTPNWTMTLMHL
jgi:hypothetical protein